MRKKLGFWVKVDGRDAERFRSVVDRNLFALHLIRLDEQITKLPGHWWHGKTLRTLVIEGDEDELNAFQKVLVQHWFLPFGHHAETVPDRCEKHDDYEPCHWCAKAHED